MPMYPYRVYMRQTCYKWPTRLWLNPFDISSIQGFFDVWCVEICMFLSSRSIIVLHIFWSIFSDSSSTPREDLSWDFRDFIDLLFWDTQKGSFCCQLLSRSLIAWCGFRYTKLIVTLEKRSAQIFLKIRIKNTSIYKFEFWVCYCLFSLYLLPNQRA
jgi:hypothetical protein